MVTQQGYVEIFSWVCFCACKVILACLGLLWTDTLKLKVVHNLHHTPSVQGSVHISDRNHFFPIRLNWFWPFMLSWVKQHQLIL